MPADQNSEHRSKTTISPVNPTPAPRPDGTVQPESNHEPLDERGTAK